MGIISASNAMMPRMELVRALRQRGYAPDGPGFQASGPRHTALPLQGAMYTLWLPAARSFAKAPLFLPEIR